MLTPSAKRVDGEHWRSQLPAQRAPASLVPAPTATTGRRRPLGRRTAGPGGDGRAAGVEHRNPGRNRGEASAARVAVRDRTRSVLLRGSLAPGPHGAQDLLISSCHPRVPPLGTWRRTRGSRRKCGPGRMAGRIAGRTSPRPNPRPGPIGLWSKRYVREPSSPSGTSIAAQPGESETEETCTPRPASAGKRVPRRTP